VWIGPGSPAVLIAMSLLGPVPAVAPPVMDPTALHLESHRLRSAVVYVGTVAALRRLGDLDGLTGPTQGRMEATIAVGKMLRTSAGTPVPAEAVIPFDDRTPDPEGDGFYSLGVGQTVLVFADGWAPAYPRELFHGTPASLAADVKALRDFVASLDADGLVLHGLTAATRASQGRLYDDALAAIAPVARKGPK
jgi:hypothetical protein